MNKIHKKLVIESGGEITEDVFITKPGIMITQVSEPTKEFNILADVMNLDIDRPMYETHSELNSRLTYMTFKDSKSSSKEYNYKMVKTYQHLSIFNDHSISILIAGISIEASQEIVAHNEASVARLTSSKTKAQTNPLFVLNNYSSNDLSIEYINKLKELRSHYINGYLENDNMMFPCNKAISIVVTMSLKDWHKTLIGRLSYNGVEREVRDVMERICDMLYERYPLVILTKEDYYTLSNGKKYE